MCEISRESVKSLISKKDILQTQIDANLQVLQINKVDRKCSLVDNEGYPRNDIDVFAVRHARHDIICQENDMKALLSEIQDALHKLHAQQTQNTNENRDIEMDFKRTNKPFLVISQVGNGSPAEKAGMKNGDSVVKFGSANAENFKNMAQIAEIVHHTIHSTIHVTIERDGRPVNLTLDPRPWIGKGLIGCMLNPINHSL